MKLSEATRLLAVVQSFDRRTVGKADALAWFRVLEQYSYEDCEKAVIEHYTDSTDWLMPAHIVRRVRTVRAERVRAYGSLEPPRNLSVLEEQKWRREALQRVADGLETRKGIGG